MRKYFLPLLLFVLFIAGMAVFAARKNSFDESSTPGAPGSPPAAASSTADAGEVVTTGLFRSIAKRENPMVVAITTQSHVRTSDLNQLFGNGGDDFFNRFFGAPGQQQPHEEVEQALGSGFLVSPDGEILTNNHVVAGAEQIRVALFSDEHRTYPADIVGRDPLTDSALIKLKNGPAHLPAAVLGDSDALAPGDWVMAIGNPFQLGHTVTVGVISFNGRPFATTEGRSQNMLQTDASINPGNSGGPLINVRGEVVGVNSAILSDGDRGNIGIGFAVPINTVKTLLPQLHKGLVERGQLGVQILSSPITSDEAKNLGLPKPAGAIVSRVEPNSPADHAGLHAGDVIVEFNGKPIDDANHLTALVVNTAPRTHVSMAFYRNGQRQTANATIGKLDLEHNEGEPNQRSTPQAAPGFGLSLGDITPDIANQLRLPAGVRGAVVENVEALSPAATAGVKPGDVILEVNRHGVHSAQDASRELRSIKAGEPAFLLLSRAGVQEFVELHRE
jgi:serine protease Do